MGIGSFIAKAVGEATLTGISSEIGSKLRPKDKAEEAESEKTYLQRLVESTLYSKCDIRLFKNKHFKVEVIDMRSIRYLISLGLLTIFFLFSAASVFAADSYATGPIHYSLDSAGSATITEYDSGEGNVVVPASLDGHPVVAIGERAFYEDSAIKTVRLPDGLTTIGDEAFAGCRNLEQINIPSTVRSLGRSSFNHLSVTELTLPEGISEIPFHCFAYCSQMTTINLPSSLKTIGSYGLAYCESLKDLELPDGVTEIGQEAFWGDSQLIIDHLPSGIETVEYGTVLFAHPKSKKFTFSKNIKKINEYEFHSNMVNELYFYSKSAPEVPNLRLSKEFTVHIRDGATGFNTKPWTNSNIVKDIQPCSTHKWDNGIIIKPATCSSEGEALFTCNVCGLTKNDVISKLGHNWNSEYTIDKKATIGTDGNKSKHCTRDGCKAVKDSTVIPAIENNLTLSKAEYAYDGTEKKPTATVKDVKGSKISTTNYSVSYSNNKNAGSAKATVTFKGDTYTGKLSKDFVIKKVDQTLLKANVLKVRKKKNANIKTILNNGITGKLTYKIANKKVATVNSSKGTVKGVKAGTTSLTVKAAGDANHNAATETVKVFVQEVITKATLTKTKFTYNGKEQKPGIKNVNKKKLKVNKDYTVTWPTKPIDAGTYKVVITATLDGNYDGSVTKTYKIVQAKQKITASASSVKVGETTQIKTTAPGTGKVTYKSKSAKIASVDSKGVVTGKKKGTAKITITVAADKNYKKATKTIKVKVVK